MLAFLHSSYFFRNFADKSAKILRLGKKRDKISLFCSRLFVTLERFAGFLYIKAMQRIEKFWGYDLETVLNSLFCYKLPERAPDSEPPPVS